MNVGIVSARYAEALLKYVNETGNGDAVYKQTGILEKCFSTLEDMRMLIYNPKATSDELKMRVLTTAVGGREKAAPELVKFFRLVMKNKRTKFFSFLGRCLHSIFESER